MNKIKSIAFILENERYVASIEHLMEAVKKTKEDELLESFKIGDYVKLSDDYRKRHNTDANILNWGSVGKIIEIQEYSSFPICVMFKNKKCWYDVHSLTKVEPPEIKYEKSHAIQLLKDKLKELENMISNLEKNQYSCFTSDNDSSDNDGLSE